jgi:nucleoside-specific outer membrane channel protein Tsx
LYLSYIIEYKGNIYDLYKFEDEFNPDEKEYGRNFGDEIKFYRKIELNLSLN